MRDAEWEKDGKERKNEGKEIQKRRKRETLCVLGNFNVFSEGSVRTELCHHAEVTFVVNKCSIVLNDEWRFNSGENCALII